jgi:hypothetical protein
MNFLFKAKKKDKGSMDANGPGQYDPRKNVLE